MEKSAKNVLLIFRSVHLPRTVLASTAQICQLIQYFGVSWYLPVTSTAMFGKNFIYVILCSLFSSVFGVVGGFPSPTIGCRLGLCRLSAIGFAVVFLVLLTLGLFNDSMPLWASLLVPMLSIPCHSGGPGANGKSPSSFSFHSELRAGVNGMVGAFGATGAALGSFILPAFRDLHGL